VIARALVLLALAAPAAAPGADASVEALVRQCLDAYGGEAMVRHATALREVGAVTSILHLGEVGSLRREWARPGRLRVAISYSEDMLEVRILDGVRGWRGGAPDAGPGLAAMMLQAARMDLPAVLHERRAQVVARGTWEHEGTVLRVLAVEVGPGLEVEAGIDPGTGRILRSRGFSRDPKLPLEFVTTYSDFRMVGGVLVAFHEANWANGKTTGDTLLEAVEVLPTLPGATFRP
jgi:hypothetical protein